MPVAKKIPANLNSENKFNSEAKQKSFASLAIEK